LLAALDSAALANIASACDMRVLASWVDLTAEIAVVVTTLAVIKGDIDTAWDAMACGNTVLKAISIGGNGVGICTVGSALDNVCLLVGINVQGTFVVAAAALVDLLSSDCASGRSGLCVCGGMLRDCRAGSGSASLAPVLT
jgi:hypothetical protein